MVLVGLQSLGPWVTLGEHSAFLSLSPQMSGVGSMISEVPPILRLCQSPPTLSQPLASMFRRHQIFVHHSSSKVTSCLVQLSRHLYMPLPSGDGIAKGSGSGTGATQVGVRLGSPPADPAPLGKWPSVTSPHFPHL